MEIDARAGNVAWQYRVERSWRHKTLASRVVLKVLRPEMVRKTDLVPTGWQRSIRSAPQSSKPVPWGKSRPRYGSLPSRL